MRRIWNEGWACLASLKRRAIFGPSGWIFAWSYCSIVRYGLFPRFPFRPFHGKFQGCSCTISKSPNSSNSLNIGLATSATTACTTPLSRRRWKMKEFACCADWGLSKPWPDRFWLSQRWKPRPLPSCHLSGFPRWCFWRGLRLWLFFQPVLDSKMACTENPACGTKALPFLIGIVERFWIDGSAFLLAVQHPATAAVLAFVSLGATLVLAVFHDVFALATVAEPIFYYHLIRFLGQIYISVNLCHYRKNFLGRDEFFMTSGMTHGSSNKTTAFFPIKQYSIPDKIRYKTTSRRL